MQSENNVGLRWLRLIMVSLTAIALAAVSLLQALGDAMERNEPVSAAQLAPFNGHALERLAYSRFKQDAGALSIMQEVAQPHKPIAVLSFLKEPLVPKSLALLALAEEDSLRRRTILERAEFFNRRDPFFQRVMLNQAIDDGDFDGIVSAVDKVLRVRPRRSEELFPLLVSALERPESAREFVQILDFSSPWHERFLLTAVRSADARLTLAKIHNQLDTDNEDYHRLLIGGLAAQGEPTTAFEIYRDVRVRLASGSETQTGLDWDSAIPPFDWALTSDSDIRGQVSRDLEVLELFARSGQGGRVAQRTIEPSLQKFMVSTIVDANRKLDPGNLVLTVSCRPSNTLLAKTDLKDGANTIPLETGSAQCSQISLVIEARSFTGEPNLRATLSKLQLRSSTPTNQNP